ncbi:MAG: hypothetical protein COT88_00165 [Candidatus Colwellbacteria bacterium CG10_big_fil_rev_8_21_14_0_10_41_28]|uniref:Tyrosine specific protein phosphatases domain-containing protein n=1 Tax=Candidatus Colwellbacteria bacterium CG10_big_fil_rev_8_21_14_0_10_41_28 TaxID=1974539 RepID=A0A2H0VHX1_9BACT|nr:MAG: hypothetical protein COT88_00165 [Candidatus Colwellbacteria bacterium CG10_big_fil_rev_8_21_14_0_10_41_28]
MIPKSHEGEIVKFEYNYIDEDIYLGSTICCEEDFNKTLRKEGVSAIISTEEHTSPPSDIEFYLHIPTKDTYSLSQDQLTIGVETIEELVFLKKKVYIHCTYGIGRSPTLLAAYLIKTRALSIDEAEQFLKEKRPVVDITDRQKVGLSKYQESID